MVPPDDPPTGSQPDDPPAGGADPDHERSGGEFDSSPEANELAVEVRSQLLPSREPLRTIFRGIGVLEQIVGSLLLLLILTLVLIQVAQRYIPGAWPWTGEVARYSLVWATFLMGGYLIANHPYHIAIHIVDFVVAERGLAVIKLLVNVLILVTTLVLMYGSYELVATDIGQVTPAAELPMRFVNTLPLIGLFLIALRAVLGIVVDDVPALRARSGDVT
jgi:TRAP-type C4-dicarboxylate transport system permease small subunit